MEKTPVRSPRPSASCNPADDRMISHFERLASRYLAADADMIKADVLGKLCSD